MTAQYVCTQPKPTSTIYGGFDCDQWELLAQPAPLFPELTKADADAITLAIISVMVLAWGWRQIKLMIR